MVDSTQRGEATDLLAKGLCALPTALPRFLWSSGDRGLCCFESSLQRTFVSGYWQSRTYTVLWVTESSVKRRGGLGPGGQDGDERP